MSRPILCVDFDGVIHSYSSGWQGADVIPDPPVPGAMTFLREATEHFRVAVHSSCSSQPGGKVAMLQYLWENAEHVEDQIWIDKIEWPSEKPPALVTIDDRAITFTGEWPSVESLLSFVPWNKREKKS